MIIITTTPTYHTNRQVQHPFHVPSFLWTLITNEIISLFLFPYFAQLP